MQEVVKSIQVSGDSKDYVIREIEKAATRLIAEGNEIISITFNYVEAHIIASVRSRYKGIKPEGIIFYKTF